MSTPDELISIMGFGHAVTAEPIVIDKAGQPWRAYHVSCTCGELDVESEQLQVIADAAVSHVFDKVKALLP